MSLSPQQTAELHEMLWALRAGVATPDELASLERRVCEDPQVRAFYVRYMHLCADLHWAANDELPTEGGGRRVEGGTALFPTPGYQSPILDLSVQHSAFSIQHSYVGGVLFSYMIAAVIFGTALAVAWMWKLPDYQQVVRQSVPLHSPLSTLPSFVGQITGMVDCQWSDPNTATIDRAHVPLGRKYVLSSGLMEITYDSGAKVILQGPVSYTVESAAGGFVSVGKLTARVEKKEERRTKNEELSASRSSFLIPHSYFAVRTPTAIVTDLGTEFGVTVSEEGLTEVHVLQGAVDTMIAGLPDDAQRHERVTEGQAVQIGPKTREIEAVAFAPQPFTRKLEAAPETPAETAYIKAVLADKPLGYWPLNERGNSRTFRDRSGNGVNGYGMNKVMAGQPGPLSAVSRAVALDGTGYIDFGRRDQFAMPNDFTVDAWVWIGEVEYSSFILSTLGGRQHNHIGWGLVAGRRQPEPKSDAENPVVLSFIAHGVADAVYFSLPHGKSIEARWLHLAVVFDRASVAHLYLNGEHRGSAAIGKPALVGPVWLQIGCAQIVDSDFYRGRLAHVAVYPRALSEQQIQNHYGQRDGGKEETDR